MGSILDSADVWVTVPAAWDARGCALMREAGIAAGLVQSAYAGDIAWRDRLKIITEPEAAAVHCAHLTDLYKLLPAQNFIVCDAGGGTVDLAVYKVRPRAQITVVSLFGAHRSSVTLRTSRSPRSPPGPVRIAGVCFSTYGFGLLWRL